MNKLINKKHRLNTRGSAMGHYCISKTWKWILLIAVLLFIIVIRIRLLDFPLERDEGEYAYFGQLILQGILPYDIAYNMKFPGTYYAYAMIMALFGQTIQGIHMGLLLVNIISTILIFLLSKELVNNTVAIVSCVTYAVLSLNASVLGFAAHATHFVILPAIAGFLVLLKAFDSDRRKYYFYSGALLGTAFIMKQSGIFFCMFGFFAIVSNHIYSKQPEHRKAVFDLFVFSLSAFIPTFLILVLLYRGGVLDKFWFWTITYLAKYGSQIPLSVAPIKFAKSMLYVVDGYYLLWIASLLGLPLIFSYSKLKNKRILILLFVFFSFLSICPGFYFRPHYFITLLPSVGILAGISFDYLNSRLVKNVYLVIILFFVMVLSGINEQKAYLFIESPTKLCRKIYGGNPFPESIKIAKFIQSRSDKNDTVAVMGSEPQIYFYSKRHSATGYIYVYGLMEKHHYSLYMQKEMAREIESSSPKFFVSVQVPTSWLKRPDSECYIFDWFHRYILEKYEIVGVADIFSDMTIYKWEDEAAAYKPKSKSNVIVYKKK